METEIMNKDRRQIRQVMDGLGVNFVHWNSIPEVFGLKLMSLDAGNDGLLAVNCFPIYLPDVKGTCVRLTTADFNTDVIMACVCICVCMCVCVCVTVQTPLG